MKNIYSDNINNIDFSAISNEEVISLIEIIRGENYSGKDRMSAKSKIILLNLRLVVKMTRTFMCHNVDFDELYTAGIQGILDAIQDYEAGEIPFYRIAHAYIRRNMMAIVEHEEDKELLNYDGIIFSKES